MPTDFQLAEGGGVHYQPWLGATVGAGSAGMGGGAGGFAGPDTWATGGGTVTGGPGPINPNIWGGTDTTGSGNTVTDTSGNQWVMSPGGQWYPATSDYGQGLLGTGRLFYDQHYDSSGHYIGAEGADTRNNLGNSPAFSLQERMTGIATDYGGKWGDRQMGLNLLGKTGMYGKDFGTYPASMFDVETMGGYGPEGQGESELDIDAAIDFAGGYGVVD